MAAPVAETLHRLLIEELAAAGTLAEDWREAFEAVPRHVFIPDITWHQGTANGKWGLISLTVGQDGAATGGIVDRTWFRQLRDQRFPRSSVADVVRGDYHGEESTTTIEPYELAGHRGAMLAIGLRVPHCCHRYFSYDPADGVGELWFLDPWSGSWASHFHVTPDCTDDEFSIRQHVPRRLWDEVRAAHAWWTEQGRPGEQDWVFTVYPDHQTVELPTRLS